MKSRKFLVIGIILIIAVAVTAGLWFNKKTSKQLSSSQDNENINQAVTPSLSAYYGTERLGTIDGYINKMEQPTMRDSIIPVSPNRDATIKISSKDISVNKITYEITSTDNNRLIDNGEIKNWSKEKNEVTFKFQASAIMNAGEEYFMMIKVETKNYSTIYYYTRVVVSDKEFVQNQIKFAKDFADKTLNSADASKLAGYLEPDTSLPNDNFGNININVSYTVLIWGSMSMTRVGDISIIPREICIKDSGEAGTYTMNYQVKGKNSNNIEETYNVSETITVWTCNGRQYVLSYNREVNQVWTADSNNIGSSFIDLGIQNTTNIEHVESEKGTYISFEINGDVYVMNLTTKTVTPIFKLNGKNMETFNKTNARVMKVDEEGNASFMVYGYSPSKKHSGKNGISIFKYTAKEKTSKEILFIPSNVSASIMKTQLSKLCYIGDGALYISLNNTIYYANLKTKEWGILADNLEEGTYTVNREGTRVAYNTNGTTNSDSITIVDLTTGKKHEIKAGTGNGITVCGYTGKNLVYGIAENVSNFQDVSFFPITKLVIMNDQYKEVKSYSKHNVYISNVDIQDTIINIKRVKKGKVISDDQLLDNTEATQMVAKSSFYADTLKLHELALTFVNNLDSSTALTVDKNAAVEFDSTTEIKSDIKKVSEDRFYVYFGGKLQNITTSKKQAIKEAKQEKGLVTNNNGQKIWTFEEHYNQ